MVPQYTPDIPLLWQFFHSPPCSHPIGKRIIILTLVPFILLKIIYRFDKFSIHKCGVVLYNFFIWFAIFISLILLGNNIHLFWYLNIFAEDSKLFHFSVLCIKLYIVSHLGFKRFGLWSKGPIVFGVCHGYGISGTTKFLQFFSHEKVFF